MAISKLFKNWRVLLLIFSLICVIWVVQPKFWNSGVVIQSVVKDSAADMARIQGPDSRTLPMAREKILAVNNIPISSIEDYANIVNSLTHNQTVLIKTNKPATYRLITQENNDTVEDLGLRIVEAPKTNLLKGLDLQGGTRVVLKPAEEVSDDIISTIIDNLKQRLNVYGVTDVVVTKVTDSFIGQGQSYILVEMAGVSEEQIKDLISRQGKFEATIGNKTVFSGGNDVTYVCRTAQCSGIDPRRGCSASAEGYACAFQFQISLSPTAAQKMADVTQNFDVVTKDDGRYLSEPIKLFLDDAEVDSLNVAADLKGRAVTDISISGSGAGTTQQQATSNTLDNMHKLQSVLITGSLPVKLQIVRADTISPLLGSKFLKNAIWMIIAAIIVVAIILGAYYRSFKIIIPILITMFSEILIILGIAVLIRQNFDLAAIAGIIAAVGTGVDDQIVITDEVMKKGTAENSAGRWKDRIKTAFFIIFSAYVTLVVAMIPLWFAGAGLLKGFAFTTILGVTAGVFITRPAYAAVVEYLFGKE